MKGGGDGKRMHRLRLRLLSREELALWRHAIADVTPRSRITAPVEDKPAEPPPESRSSPSVRAPTADEYRPLPPGKKPVAPSIAPLAPMERRLKRDLASGRAGVDDVIDLHGMTQARAHRELVGFLRRAAGSGARLVLVITGKGGAQRESGDWFAEERGVLRRLAPLWLHASELRSIVLSVEEAARPHGGGGALYVRLRRRGS